MRSSRPYMIRAMHEWIIDSELTPYVLVDANYTDIVIPREYIEDGKILLNISPSATQTLNLGNDYVMFSARFNNVAMEVSFPVDAVLAIYAKENGRGMMFKDDEQHSDASMLGSEASTKKKTKPSGPVGIDTLEPKATQTQPHSESHSDSGNDDPNDNGPSGSSPTKKPSLKIVK